MSACTTCSIQTIETPLAAHVADQRDEAFAFVLGEPAGDLVEQQHARSRGERTGKLEPLAVEQRERAGEPVRLVGEAAPGEDVHASGIDLALAAAPPNAAATTRFSNTVMPPNGCGIWNERAMPEMAAPLRRQCRDVAAREQHAPGIGPHRTGGDAEQRRLARAVRPDDAERLALGERKVDLFGHHDCAEAFGDFFEREDGSMSRCFLLTSPRVRGEVGSRQRSVGAASRV